MSPFGWSTAIGFLAIALASGLLAHRLLPWLVVRAGRLLGFRMEANPLTQKRLRRFREITRGYYAFLVVTTAFAASFFLELYVNNKPLYIRFGEAWRMPAAADWGNFVLDPYWDLKERLTGDTARFPTQLIAKDFGLDREGELNAREYAAWVAEPGLLESKAAGIEKDISDDEAKFRAVLAEQARNRGLVYDMKEPLPEFKTKDYEQRRDDAAKLRAFKAELALGKAWVIMPLYTYSPYEQLLDLEGSPPHKPFQTGLPVLGTDAAGIDVLAQLLYGFRISFAFGLLVTLFGYFIGVLVGAAMGYFGGWIDIGTQRVIEVWSNIPFLFTIMIISGIAAPSFWLLVGLMVVLHGWIGITYTLRGEFYREKARDYVQAARAMGQRDGKIMFRHILPNAMVPIVTFAPFAIVGDMSALVSLDYLNFGLPPGTPSWGALLRQGHENIQNYIHLIVTPVIAFAGTLFCVVLIGEAVREAFDPKRYARLR